MTQNIPDSTVTGIDRVPKTAKKTKKPSAFTNTYVLCWIKNDNVI